MIICDSYFHTPTRSKLVTLPQGGHQHCKITLLFCPGEIDFLTMHIKFQRSSNDDLLVMVVTLKNPNGILVMSLFRKNTIVAPTGMGGSVVRSVMPRVCLLYPNIFINDILQKINNRDSSVLCMSNFIFLLSLFFGYQLVPKVYCHAN